VLKNWEKGTRINCVKCGAEHFVKKGLDGFVINRLKELTVETPAAAAPVAAKPSAPPPSAPPQVEIPEPVVAAPAPPPVPQAPPAPQAATPAPEPVVHQTAHEASPVNESADTVLVVEDDRLAREMVEGAVKDLGFRLVSVKNATEAINILRKENVTLLVADLYLKNPADPESTLDGEELLKKVVDSGLKIPAIITTGKDIIDDLVLDPKWFDFNVKGFIQKGNPFWADELKLKIKEILYKG